MLKVEEVAKAISQNLEAEAGAGAFPWATIIELIMTMLGGNCFATRKSLRAYKEEIKTPGDVGVIKKIAALVVIRRELGLRKTEALKVRDEVFSAMEVLTDEELDQVFTEVVAETMPPKFVI